MATAVLQYRVNGGSVTTGTTNVVADDSIQLIAASYAGWGSPAALWEITAYPPGFPCPSGWSTDASTGHYYCLANSSSLIPPPVVMPNAAAIAGGQWGKWMFRLTVNGGGSGLVDNFAGVQIAAPGGSEDVAVGEEAQFDSERRYIGAIQRTFRAMDAAIVGGVGGGVSIGTGTPSDVDAAAGSAGASPAAAPFDHTHQVSVGTPVDIGTSNVAGAGNALARHNHVHALPWATVTSVFGAASSSLPMNGQKITGLGSPTSTNDAVTKAYADGLVSFAVIAAALGAASTVIDVNGQKITGLGTPSATDDAATKGYVDGVVGAYVPTTRAINTTSPLAGGGPLTTDITLTIGAASSSSAGTQSIAHFNLVENATEDPTANTIPKRGAGARCAFGWLAPSFANTLPNDGFIRFDNGGGMVLGFDSAASPGTTISGIAIDSSDGLRIGDGNMALYAVAAAEWKYTGSGGSTILRATDIAVELGKGQATTLAIDVTGAITVASKSWSYNGGTAATGVQAVDVAWQAQAAHSGDSLHAGGFEWVAGAPSGVPGFLGGSFTFNLGQGASGSGYTGFMRWKETSDGVFLTLRHEGTSHPIAAWETPATGEVRWSVGSGGLTVHDQASQEQCLLIDPTNADLKLTLIDTITFGSGKTGSPLSPVMTQEKLAGTDGANGPDMTIEAATGQDATGGATNNSYGGNLTLRGGQAGSGGGGELGRKGNVFLGWGSGTASGGEGVVVIHDSHTAPGAASGGVIMYSVSGNLVLKQQSPQAYTLTYGGSASRTMNAYTADVESTPYTGAADGEAKLSDLNALRAAVENLRALVENLANVQKASITDLKSIGLIG